MCGGVKSLGRGNPARCKGMILIITKIMNTVRKYNKSVVNRKLPLAKRAHTGCKQNQALNFALAGDEGWISFRDKSKSIACCLNIPTPHRIIIKGG